MDESHKQDASVEEISQRGQTRSVPFICMSRTGQSREREKADLWSLRAWEEGKGKLERNGVIFRGDEVEGEITIYSDDEIIHFKMDIIMLYGSHIIRLLSNPHSSQTLLPVAMLTAEPVEHCPKDSDAEGWYRAEFSNHHLERQRPLVQPLHEASSTTYRISSPLRASHNSLSNPI